MTLCLCPESPPQNQYQPQPLTSRTEPRKETQNLVLPRSCHGNRQLAQQDGSFVEPPQLAGCPAERRTGLPLSPRSWHRGTWLWTFHQRRAVPVGVTTEEAQLWPLPRSLGELTGSAKAGMCPRPGCTGLKTRQWRQSPGLTPRLCLLLSWATPWPLQAPHPGSGGTSRARGSGGHTLWHVESASYVSHLQRIGCGVLFWRSVES